MGLIILTLRVYAMDTAMSDGGKGSQQRPTDRQKFEENFERIFGKPKEKDKKWQR
jgi:hypothetical protein